MRILIVGATQAELIPLFTYLKQDPSKTGERQSLSYKNNDIDILITGPGINNTAYNMGRIFSLHTYDFCINAGICGSFENAIAIGEVVQVRSEQFAQLGAEDDEVFLDIFQLGIMDPDYFPFKNGHLDNHSSKEIHCLESIKKVHGITVETVHGNAHSIQKVLERFHADVESMEGAAFFHACLLNHVDFMEFRAVSNYVEKRNKENWNIGLAVANLNNFMIRVLDELTV